MPIPPERVLLVDDDRNLLASFRRQFRNRLHLVTAASGGDGIQAIVDDGPFAVVVSDMQMPNMNGVEFLSQARSISPDTVRIMLTGNADLDVATQAINNGSIFRLLHKPVSEAVIYESLIDGIQHYRLVTTEKKLLNNTLKGTVDLLTDMLGLLDPVSHGRSSRIKRHVKGMVQQLKLGDAWVYELAAMLSHLGCITLPSGLLEKANSGAQLSSQETALIENHPQIGARFLKHIPRLELVASVIEQQNTSAQQIAVEGALTAEEKATLGGQMLRVAMAFDSLSGGATGDAEASALKTLSKQPRQFNPALVHALAASSNGRSLKVSTLAIADLEPGMILNQNLFTHSGALLVAQGQELSPPILQHLILAEQNEMIADAVQVVSIS